LTIYFVKDFCIDRPATSATLIQSDKKTITIDSRGYDYFKDAMPVSFRSELLTSYILTIFKQRTYSRKYEKLSQI